MAYHYPPPAVGPRQTLSRGLSCTLTAQLNSHHQGLCTLLMHAARAAA